MRSPVRSAILIANFYSERLSERITSVHINNCQPGPKYYRNERLLSVHCTVHVIDSGKKELDDP